MLLFAPQREKEASGLADVPGGAKGKLLEVEFAFTEDRKLRGQLRDASAIEAQITALQIGALKRIGRGTKVLLLDRFGNTSKAVAKELSRRGFGRVYVVAGKLSITITKGSQHWQVLLIGPASCALNALMHMQDAGRSTALSGYMTLVKLSMVHLLLT